MAVWDKALREASGGSDIDQTPVDDGGSTWMLGQERGWAEGKANTKSMRRSVPGILQEQ